MKKIAVGMLAHVDSGKTTLSEGLLFCSGKIKKLGRVDHKNSFLDTDKIERERGITIFSKQAVIDYKDTHITLLDTPGHVDFSAETERTLRILDYAVLVISATDGVQSHTETLWKLLSHYEVPTFVFVNKMDIAQKDKEAILTELKEKLSDGICDFSTRDGAFFENAALSSAELLEEYTETETISKDSLSEAILKRNIFPCIFGAALKEEGTSELLDLINFFTVPVLGGTKFGARVYKISEDEHGKRLTQIKITSGTIAVKSMVSGEKVNEIRIYSGEKYTQVMEASKGEVVALTGLTKTSVGQGIGCEISDDRLISEPVFSYTVKPADGSDIHKTLTILRKLQEEEEQLNVVWNDRLQTLEVHLMGEVQLEVLKSILEDRFNLKVEFLEGNIIYKETIADTVYGVGHFEPLRHYAEVQLKLEPNKGEGLVFKTKCSEDILDRSWQRLIMTHLEEKQHLGTLIGMPITDVTITLLNGRAHKKHTEGGDFRQATYRAVRQGLMQAKGLILEPYYNFRLYLPMENTGKAMSDLDIMGASFSSPESIGEMWVISGSAPVFAIRNYQRSVIAYTHGRGRLTVSFKGYGPCKNEGEVIEKFAYNPENDLENTPDSVFCANGSGFAVKWDKVFDYMHIPLEKKDSEYKTPSLRQSRSLVADEEELLRIFERTYGKITRKSHGIIRTKKAEPEYKMKSVQIKDEFLLIDGYNIIFANDELSRVAENNLEDARDLLLARLAGYRAVRDKNIILVFDAYKVHGARREIEDIHGIKLVYTREAETADSYIEKTTKELIKNYRVRVATSDGLEQMIIFGSGAVRVTPKELFDEIKTADEEIREFIKNNNKG